MTSNTTETALPTNARCTYPVPLDNVAGGAEPCGLTQAQHGAAMTNPHAFTLASDPAPEETEVDPLPETPGDPEPLPADGTTHELDADGVPFVSVSYSRGDGIVVAMQWTGTEDHVTVEALFEVAAGGLQAMRDAAADDAATAGPTGTGTEHVIPDCGEVTPDGDGTCERAAGHDGQHAAWPGGTYERKSVRW